MTTAMTAIPQWTREDFEGLAPYEWLAQFREDKFQLELQLTRVQKAAASVGFRRFLTVWRGYLKQLGEVARNDKKTSATEFSGQELELMCGAYTCTDDGIFCAGFGDFEQQVISHPIMPVKRLVNIDTNEERMQLSYRRGAHWKKLVVPKATLASAQKIVSLASNGIGVTSENARALVCYLSELEAWNYDALGEQMAVGRLGWLSDGTFSPYCADVEYDGENEELRRMFNSFTSHGSREKWLEMARGIRSGESMAARIMLAAAFAGPLVQPLSALPFFVHFWGDTGCGKTVGLHVAASVWADPKAGYVKTMDATAVGLEQYASFCRNVPIILNELQILAHAVKDFDGIIYTLCEGMGRMRGAKEGGLRSQGRWSTCMLSTGEEPILKANSGGGAAARVIEVTAGGQQYFSDFNQIMDTCCNNYGFAGREFVEAMSDPEVMQQLRVVQKALFDELSKNSKVNEKQLLSASVLLTADFFADVLLFKDGKALTCEDIVPFLTTKDAVDVQARCYEYIMGALGENQQSFIIKDKDGHDIMPSNRVMGIIDQRKNVVNACYIVKTAFDRMLIEAGYSPTAFLSWAKRKGLLVIDRDGSNTNHRCTCRKTIDKVRVICVGLRLDDGFAEVDEEDQISFDD